MTINRALHPKADVGRIDKVRGVDVRRVDIGRIDRGRGMNSVEERVRLEENSLSDYLNSSVHNEHGVMNASLKDQTT